MPRGWEGNRRSGVALAMRHGLKWFIHLRAQRPQVGDEHPAYAPAGAWFRLPFTFYIRNVTIKRERIYLPIGVSVIVWCYLLLYLQHYVHLQPTQHTQKFAIKVLSILSEQ